LHHFWQQLINPMQSKITDAECWPLILERQTEIKSRTDSTFTYRPDSAIMAMNEPLKVASEFI
jgi:hypothetical protein